MQHLPPDNSWTGRRILVADEDPESVTFLVTTLRNAGHIVFHAYDLLSVVQLAQSFPVDLVLSDTKVSGTDGVELINLLRREQPRLPFIYLANSGRSSPALEAQLPNDVPILREPFTVEKIRSVVTAMLDGRRPPGGESAG
jgi:CheY-like chemotaxis protein